MTHAHDKTLIAQLGFADADRREPLHDMACRYLAQPEQAERLVRLVDDWALPKARTATKAWSFDGMAELEGRMEALRVVDRRGGSRPQNERGDRYYLSSLHPFASSRSLAMGPSGLCVADAEEVIVPDPTAHHAHVALERFAAERHGEIATLLADLIACEPLRDAHGKERPVTITAVEARRTVTKAVFERPITKGQGQYKTTIGFADVFLRTTMSARCVYTWTTPNGASETWEQWDPLGLDRASVIVVEVKAQPVPASEILRQLRLYAEYLAGDPILVAATLFEMPSGEVDMLRSQEVRTIRLGDPFQTWAAAQSQPKSGKQTPEVF